MPKVSGNGQAKILSVDELNCLFAAFKNERDRALYAVCFFSGCRISEALALRCADLGENTITFRKQITKGKLSTRAIALHPKLKNFLEAYQQSYKLKPDGFLFPGRRGQRDTLNRGTADLILRRACHDARLVGVSTHSFRRTALTQLSNTNVPLRVIQAVSGHRDLGTLQRYLEVTDQQVDAAVNSLDF